jgi:hypothetical protein
MYKNALTLHSIGASCSGHWHFNEMYISDVTSGEWWCQVALSMYLALWRVHFLAVDLSVWSPEGNNSLAKSKAYCALNILICSKLIFLIALSQTVFECLSGYWIGPRYLCMYNWRHGACMYVYIIGTMALKENNIEYNCVWTGF